MISLSIYQANLCVITTLILLMPIYDIVVNKKEFNYVLKNFIRTILSILIGIVFYWLFLQLILKIEEIQMSDFKGANEVGIMNSIFNFTESIKYVYKYLYDFIFTDTILKNSFYARGFWWCILSGCAFVFIVINIVKEKVYKDIKKILTVIICGCLLPIGLGSIKFITIGVDINLLMSSAMI